MSKQIKGRKFFAATASAALVASAIVPVAAAAEDFRDKSQIAPWAYQYVDALVDHGVIKGDDNNNFNPRASLTRAEAAVMFKEAFGLQSNGSSSFTDVANNVWYTDAVLALADNGLVKGYENGTFKPSGKITRQEAAVIIANALNLDKVNNPNLSAFADGASVPTWAAGYVAAVVDAGLMQGSQQGNQLFLNGAKDISRQEFSVLFQKTGVEAGLWNAVSEETNVDNEAVESVTAVNNTTVEITYKEDVDNVKATSYSIDGLEVTNAAVKQGQQNVVVLTTSTQEGGKVYTVKENGETVGTFEGISAIVPEKITLTESSFQGVVGEEVTITADIGQKVKNVPVTFSVDSGDRSLNRDIVQEVLTDENGIATFSYTQYNAASITDREIDQYDDVFVYPTGAPAKRALAYVYWGVTESLKLEAADDKGNNINNGESKLYKVTYVDPKDGKPLTNRDLYVTLEENVDVTYDKISKATVNGQQPYQVTNKDEEYGVQYVKITTNSKGEATFTVTGKNTTATPIVFVNNIESDKNKLDARERQVKAEKLVIGAEQADYKIEIVRSGTEEATVSKLEGSNSDTVRLPQDRNGRVYKITVTNEDGKAASNEVVNVTFNEIEDKDMNTETRARIFDYDRLGGDKDEDYLGDFVEGHGTRKATLKLNSKGETEFRVASDEKDDYATPIVWIDINNADAREGNLDNGEPYAIGDIVYFSETIMKNGRVRAYDNNWNRVKNNRSFNAGDKAFFRYEATNQSNERESIDGIVLETEYTVFNTGTDPVAVYWNDGDTERRQEISPNRSYTVKKLEGTNNQPEPYIWVETINGKSAKVRVEASAVTKLAEGYKKEDSKELRANDSQFLGKYSETATFKGSTEIGTIYTGTISQALNIGDRTFRFAERQGTLVSYRDASAFIYNNAAIDVDYFEQLVDANLGTVRVTVERNAEGDFDKFTIVSLGGGTGNPPQTDEQKAADDVTTQIANLPPVANLTKEDAAKVDAARDAYNALTAEQQALVTNVDTLVAAEAKIAELKGEDPEENIITITSDTYSIMPVGESEFALFNLAGTIASDEVTEVKVTVVDGAEQDAIYNTTTGEFTFTEPSIEPENGEVTVVAYDAAGNIVDSITVKVSKSN